MNLNDAIGQKKPSLFFREDWKEIPAQLPITKEHVANSNLILKTYGPGGDNLKKGHHNHIPNDPWYLWSGKADGPWAASLRHKNKYVDLTGTARIKWRTRQSGFHKLYLILKLKNGNWIISDQADGYASDWRVHEFIIRDIRWRKFDIKNINEGNWLTNPDLSEVVEIGFTDLRGGGGSLSSSRLDWIEVYGEPIEF